MDSTLFESLGRELAPEQVTNRLREAITSGVLLPGARLNQGELAERLGVSRMPIREALQRLQVEGLVTLQPYRGAIVSGLSKRELQEIYEMRIALEVLALRIGLQEGGLGDLDAAQSILEDMDGTADSDAWLELNASFHDLLYAGADRPLLLETVAVLRNKSDRYLRLFASMRDRKRQAQSEHWAILEALKEPNPGRACDLLRNHLQSTIASLSTALSTDAKLEPEEVAPSIPSPKSTEE